MAPKRSRSCPPRARRVSLESVDSESASGPIVQAVPVQATSSSGPVVQAVPVKRAPAAGTATHIRDESQSPRQTVGYTYVRLIMRVPGTARALLVPGVRVGLHA